MIPPKKFPPYAPGAGRQSSKTIQTKPLQSFPARPTGGPHPPQPNTPAAPPAYRPQPTPKVLQPKAHAQLQPARQTNLPPAAPLAYRPQPVPKVLQTKVAAVPTTPRAQPPSRPAAPQVYRPNLAQRCLQTKAATRPQPPVNPSKHAPSAPARTAPGGPSPSLPHAAHGGPPRAQPPKPLPPVGGALGGVVQPLASKNVIQRVWVKVDGTGHPGDYYWDDNFGNTPYDPMRHGPPPHGGRQVPNPFQFIPDTHKSRSGGSMTSLRTRPDYPEQRMDLLTHYMGQLVEGRGEFYEGPTEIRTLGSMPVTTTIPPRSSEYTTNFSRETGGFRSSTKYQSSLGIGPTIEGGYQILHIGGHGQLGKISNTGGNLCSGGHGTNSYMIPYDDLTSGDPNVSIASYAVCRPGTLRAEWIVMQFFYAGFAEPFFVQQIDGDLGKLTRSQYESIKEDAKRRIGDAKMRKHAAMLATLFQSEHEHVKKFGGGPPPGSGGGGFGGGGLGGGGLGIGVF